MINDLTEGDAFALLTDLRDGLRNDGYDLSVVSVSPRVQLTIRAGTDVCEDCLVGKSLMTTYVVTALRDAAPAIAAEDVEISYPADAAGGEAIA